MVYLQSKLHFLLIEKYIISQCPISVADVEEAVSKILISFKSGKKVATWGKRKNGNNEIVQEHIIVPRGALSEESVYGKIRVIEEKKKPVKYLFEHPDLIFKPYIKALVTQRLDDFGGDEKKAIASLKNNPIYLKADKTELLEYGTCFKEEYVIKYVVNTDFNKVDKVIDNGIRRILKNRLDKFGGKNKEAFKDVAKDGKILKWYEDEGLERPIKSVRCSTGLSAVVPIRKDEDGKEIGFVKPGNNHHVAIYADDEGKWQEHVCTFWHAVERKKYGLPVIIKDTGVVWDKVLDDADSFSQSFLNQLPEPNMNLVLSMQQNEMFILELDEEVVRHALANRNYRLISEHLYRVQKLSSRDYVFRHHLETAIVDDNDSKVCKRFFSIRSLKALAELKPYKVRIDYLGNIIPLLP